MKITPLQLEVLRQLERATDPMFADSFGFGGVAVPRDVVDRMVVRGLLEREPHVFKGGPAQVTIARLGRAALDAGDDPTRITRLATSGPLAGFTANPTLSFKEPTD